METVVQPGTAGELGREAVSASVEVGHDFASVYAADRANLVRALSLSLRDEALANEAIDEAFTRALHRWHVVGSFPAPQAWVYRTAHNWATSRFRRRSRDARYAPLIARSEERTEKLPDPELAAALASLASDHRDVLVLRYYLDWTIDACAQALDIAPGTVKSRTSRALEELKRILGER